MKRIPIYFFCLLAIACKNDPNKAKTTLVVGDTAHYYPVSDFFREQVMYVDLRDFPIYQLSKLDEKQDSTVITKDAFLLWGAAFAEQAALFQKNKYLYKESVFKDLSTNSYTLTYSAADSQETDIQNIDILLDEETNIAKRVFIKRVYVSRDTTVTEQYSWKAFKSFQVTRFKTAGSGFSSTAIHYVNWNDK